MTLGTVSENVLFEAEGAGWVTLRQRLPALGGLNSAELLDLGALLPGNLRYARIGGEVSLIGEVRADGGEAIDSSRARLASLLGGGPPTEELPPEEDEIESALNGAGFIWTRRQESWSVTLRERFARELLVQAVPGGVQVEATLTEWEDIPEVARQALEQFLVAAQAGVRHARLMLVANRALVRARATMDRLDADLPHAILGAAAACEALAREATALLEPIVAENYLSLFRTV